MWHRPSGRSRQNPKVFPCWITYKRMCVIRRERNDLIVTPNLRNERKESWSEPHLEDRIRLSFADNTSYTLCLSLPLPRFGCCVFLVWWSPPSRLVFPQPAATGAQTKPTVPRNRLRVARRLQARARAGARLGNQVFDKPKFHEPPPATSVATSSSASSRPSTGSSDRTGKHDAARHFRPRGIRPR